MATWDFEGHLEKTNAEALRQVLRGLVYERVVSSMEICKRCKAAVHIDDSLPRTERPIFQLEGYADLKYLSSGGFGVVAQGRMVNSNEKVAIKRMPLEGWQNAVRLIREIFYMINLDHPNVCNIIDVQFYSEYLFLVTPLCQPGSLTTFIPSDAAEVKMILTGMYCGLEYLHHAGVCHRDVKPDNIFVHRVAEDEYGRRRPKVLVADLGMARLSVSKSHTIANEMCTPNYLAPELLKGIAYDYPADVWASAVTVFEFVVTVGKTMPSWVLFPSCTAGTRRHYDQSVALVEKSDTWGQNRWKMLNKCLSKHDALFANAEIPTILSRCLKISPEERPTVSELLHEFRYSLDVESSIHHMRSTCGPYSESEQGICFESFQEDLAKMPSAQYRMRKIRMQLGDFQDLMKRRRRCSWSTPSTPSIYKRVRSDDSPSSENCASNKRHTALPLRTPHGTGSQPPHHTSSSCLKSPIRGASTSTLRPTLSSSGEREVPGTPVSVPPARMRDPSADMTPKTPPRNISYRLPVTPQA